MRRDICITVFAAALLLPACAGTQPTGEIHGMAMDVRSKVAPQGDPSACDRIQGNTCIINVTPTVSGSRCTISMKAFVGLGTLASVNHVQWDLQNGFEFCKSGGDGVFFTDLTAPFDPDPNGACKSNWKSKRNAVSASNFSYSMQFRKGTTVCTLDPWLRNN